MDATDRFAEATRWLRYAEEDLIAAETLLGQPHVVPRHACWLAQQAAEKALKAVLVFLQIDFPRSHDLDALRNLVPDGRQLKVDHPDLASLTEWAVRPAIRETGQKPQQRRRTRLLNKPEPSGHQSLPSSHNTVFM